jgi:hypothetical protein
MMAVVAVPIVVAVVHKTTVVRVVVGTVLVVVGMAIFVVPTAVDCKAVVGSWYTPSIKTNIPQYL